LEHGCQTFFFLTNINRKGRVIHTAIRKPRLKTKTTVPIFSTHSSKSS